MPDVKTSDPQDLSEDKLAGFLDNRFFVFQPRSGAHKSGLDAVLIAATVPSDLAGRVADFGAGNGTAGMAAAQRCSGIEVDLLEIDDASFLRMNAAKELAQNSHMSDRIHPVKGDICEKRLLRQMRNDSGPYQMVIANPPFNDASHRASPNSNKAFAHVLRPGDLAKWVDGASALLQPKGRLTLILRPSGLIEIIEALRPAFGAIVIRPVHPKTGQPASRVLVAAAKGSKAALQILPSMILHNEDGSFSGEAEEILRGRTGISL